MSNPYNRVTADAFQQMQLDAGVLLDEFDWANPFDTPDDEHIIATTTGGINPVCEPTYEDLGEDVDNVPNNMLDFLKLTGWNCQMSFTSIKFNAANTKWALSAADEGDAPTGAPYGTTRIVPRANIKMSDAQDIYAAFPMADGGIFVVVLKNAVSTGGLNIQSTKNGKGTNKVTLTGYVTADAQDEMPMEFIHIPSADPFEVTVASVAGSTSGTTKITTDYTLKSEESWAYKTGAAAVEVARGDEISTSGGSAWTSWNGSADITATTGNIITLVVVADGHARGVGTATITSKS